MPLITTGITPDTRKEAFFTTGKRVDTRKMVFFTTGNWLYTRVKLIAAYTLKPSCRGL